MYVKGPRTILSTWKCHINVSYCSHNCKNGCMTLLLRMTHQFPKTFRIHHLIFFLCGPISPGLCLCSTHLMLIPQLILISISGFCQVPRHTNLTPTSSSCVGQSANLKDSLHDWLLIPGSQMKNAFSIEGFPCLSYVITASPSHVLFSIIKVCFLPSLYGNLSFFFSFIFIVSSSVEYKFLKLM